VPRHESVSPLVTIAPRLRRRRAASLTPADAEPVAMDDDHDSKLRFRTIWISDLHLGSVSCQAALLLDFLRQTESEHLYLVGDIVDGWQLRRRWFWPQAHNDIVQKVLRKARKGTSVTYIPGNHDAFGRHFSEISFGGIEVREEALHRTADGRRLLVVHGDLFDGVIQHAKWLAFVGDRLYLFTLELNRWFNALRARLGFPYWSLSQFLKHKVKNAVSYITDFEIAVAQEARRRGVDGVVCGHIHKAEIRSIGGVLYCNDGDWVESLTALVEDDAGKLSILHWKDVAAKATATVAAAADKEVLLAHSAGD
jgi:UDP-2,3-diacylglucosamine pyrophosphatase LpxH